MTEQELRKQTHELIGEYIGQTMPDNLFERLVGLFKRANYVRLADVQMLPEVIGQSSEERRAKRSYADGMLRKGGRKVELP